MALLKGWVGMNQSIFNLLKVGIGPSSSHTLGPMRMAIAFRNCLLNSKILSDIHELRVTLYGSLALTGEGHLTPNAIVSGLSGHDPIITPIAEIQNASTLLSERKFLKMDACKISVEPSHFIHFKKSLKNLQHPNTATFEALDKNGVVLLGKDFCSIGGGMICTPDVVLSQFRKQDRPKISLVKILSECKRSKISLLEWLIRQEKKISKLNESEIYERLDNLWQIMVTSIKKGLQEEGSLPGKLGVHRRAKKAAEQFEKTQNPLQKALPAIGKAGIYALAVSEENASGGRVVTAPTCGACGVVPGVLYMLNQDLCIDHKKILQGLAIAGLIGNIVVDRASISGAEVGCQGEVGVACSMAAAACTMINGGSNAQIEEAAEAALEHHLGLTCDPVMGLVQVPCIERNAIASGTAINSSNLALLGRGEHLISFDECVDTMMATGCDMPEEYKETSLGGLATTHC